MSKPYIADTSATYMNVECASNIDCLRVLLSDICIPDDLTIEDSESLVFNIINKFRCTGNVRPEEVCTLVQESNLYDSLVNWGIEPDIFALTLYRYVTEKFHFIPIHDYRYIADKSLDVQSLVFNWLIKELIDLLKPFYD